MRVRLKYNMFLRLGKDGECPDGLGRRIVAAGLAEEIKQDSIVKRRGRRPNDSR